MNDLGIFGAGARLTAWAAAAFVLQFVVGPRSAVPQPSGTELAEDADRASRALQGIGPDNLSNLNAALDVTRLKSRHRIAWIQLRDGSGRVRAYSGKNVPPTFSMNLVEARFRQGLPIFKILRTSQGSLLIEAFPVPCAPSAKAAGHEVWGLLEIAASLSPAEPPSPANKARVSKLWVR